MMAKIPHLIQNHMKAKVLAGSSWVPFERCTSCPLLILGVDQETCMKANCSCSVVPTLDEIKSWQPCGPFTAQGHARLHRASEMVGYRKEKSLAQIAIVHGTKETDDDGNPFTTWSERAILYRTTGDVQQIAVSVSDFLKQIGYSEMEIDQFYADVNIVIQYLENQAEKREKLVAIQQRIEKKTRDSIKCDKLITFYQTEKMTLATEIGEAEAEKAKVVKELDEA